MRGSRSAPISARNIRQALLSDEWLMFLRAGRAEVSACSQTPLRQHTLAFFSIRQHTSAYVSMRQCTSEAVGAYVQVVSGSINSSGCCKLDAENHSRMEKVSKALQKTTPYNETAVSSTNSVLQHQDARTNYVLQHQDENCELQIAFLRITSLTSLFQ